MTKTAANDKHAIARHENSATEMKSLRDRHRPKRIREQCLPLEAKPFVSLGQRWHLLIAKPPQLPVLMVHRAWNVDPEEAALVVLHEDWPLKDVFHHETDLAACVNHWHIYFVPDPLNQLHVLHLLSFQILTNCCKVVAEGLVRLLRNTLNDAARVRLRLHAALFHTVHHLF